MSRLARLRAGHRVLADWIHCNATHRDFYRVLVFAHDLLRLISTRAARGEK